MNQKTVFVVVLAALAASGGAATGLIVGTQFTDTGTQTKGTVDNHHQGDAPSQGIEANVTSQCSESGQCQFSIKVIDFGGADAVYFGPNQFVEDSSAKKLTRSEPEATITVDSKYATVHAQYGSTYKFAGYYEHSESPPSSWEEPKEQENQNAVAGVDIAQEQDQSGASDANLTVTVVSMDQADEVRVQDSSGNTVATLTSVGANANIEHVEAGSEYVIIAEYNGNSNVIQTYTVQ